MGEITDFIQLYLEDSGLFEEEVSKIKESLEDNIKDIIRPGQVGYDTGRLHDSVWTSYDLINKTTAIVKGDYHADYGQYWYRWKGGKDFMNEGLERTLEAYR